MMSIITKPPTEFQDQPPTYSSVTVHNSPLVHEELEKNILVTSDYTPCSSYHQDKSICESYHKDKNIFESYYKDESICERYPKDKNVCKSYHKDKNIFESYHKDESVHDSSHKDKNTYGGRHHKNESVQELTGTSNTNENLQVPAHDKLSSINHITYLSHPETENDNHPKPASVKNRTSLLQNDGQPKPADVNTKANLLPQKQEIDPSLISKNFSNTKTQNNLPNPRPSFGEVPNSLDVASKKQFILGETDALNDDELLKTNVSSLKPPDFTSLISSQREKILKIRREERLSEERITDSKTMHKSRDRENMSFDYENILEGKKKQKNSAEMKSSSKGEKSKHKKLKKRLVDYGGFNDIFSEPLNVKEFYSDGSKKRERKIPSKFIYLSKMEKYLSLSPKSKHKKKYKSKYKLSEELTKKVKEEKDTNRETENETEERKDTSKIKMCTMKGENTGVLKQQKSVKKENRGKDSHLSSSGNNTSSKSSISSMSLKSLKKSQQLRDGDFHQHCLRRYYRLKSSNWNCSSRSALRQLKRKYNSIRLLFDSEPIVYLKRLKLRNISLKTEIDICAGEMESKSDCVKGTVPGSSAVKSEIETVTEEIESMRPMQNMMKVSVKTEPDTKVYNSVFTARRKEIKAETEDLVDPRVMSLSKTLQSTNNGKVGLEKIFKNCNSKPVKSKRKENSKSHGQSVKRKAKPDWSKWKEKLKEASNRMVERKKGGLVIEKNINRFPSTYVNIGPPSILHFRIPLKSNNKGKIEENNSSDVKGIENALNTKDADAETIPADVPESECSEVNKNALANTEDEDESKVLKEINEELTLEEYETDSFITYSINGYSIEISRDSPIDAKMNKDEKSAKNECFDEDEMNKILYGDNLDDVALDCHTRNDEEHFNERDTGLTVTSDIIPNLCAQDENIFRENGDFSDEIDKSPPVLEKLSESENFYIVRENEEQQGSMCVEETEEQTLTECIRIDDVHSVSTKTKTEISAKGELMTTNANNDVEVEISCICKDNDGFSHDEAANKTLPSNKCNSSDLLDTDDNQNLSDINGDESCDPSPFVIENVCSLNETQHVSEHCQEKEKYWSTAKADNKIDESITENGKNYGSSKDDGEIDKSGEDLEGSFEYEDLNKQDNMEIENVGNPSEELKESMLLANEGRVHCTETIESVSESEIDTCITDKGSSDIKCSVMDLKLQGLCNKNTFNINKTNELPHTNKSENLLENNADVFDRSENKVVGRKETSAFVDKKESNEKSAAAVMEDLEKMLEEMKSKSDDVENLSLKSVCVIDKGDKSEKENNINGKLSNNSAEMESCDDAEQNMFEAIKDISDSQKEKNELVKGKEKDEVEDIENELDCGISMKVTEVTEAEGYDKANAKSDINVQTTTKSSTSAVNNSTKKTDQDILSKPTNFDYENNDEQYFSSEATNNTEVSDSSEDGETEDESEMKEVIETYAAEMSLEGANEDMENGETETGKQKKRKRKIPKDHFSSCENTQSSDDNMEQNEERIMCDFPNHNWLFNKYNISEVRAEKEIVKEVKGKKQKKDDRDTVKQSAEVNSRRKSSNSTANILPTQRKQSTSKSDIYPETRHLQKADKNITGNISPEHKSIKIKWNKIKKRNSTGDSVNMGEKMDIMAEKDGDLPFDKNKLNSKYFGKFGNDALDQTNLQEKTYKVDEYSLSKKNEYNKRTFMFSNHEDTCETAANVLTKTKEIDLNMDFLKNAKGEKSLNSNTMGDIDSNREQKCKISADISSSKLKDSVFLDKIRTEKTDTAAVSLKDPNSLERMLFGDVSNDDDDDDDDEEKLEIDETACTEDASSDEKLSALNLQNTDSDEHISKFEQSTKKSVVVTTPDSVHLTDADADKLTVEEKCDLGPIAEPSTTSCSVVSIPDKGVTAEVTTLKSEVKAADTVTVKNTVTNRFEAGVLDLCAVKSEAGSISFRPRAKPPVQLVHPQVHKPPTGKIKVESVATPEIQTHVSLHTENKEESVAITTNVDSCPDQADAGSITRPGSTSAQIRSALDITVTSAVSSQLSTALVNSGTPHVPVTVLPTLAQIPTGCITVTSTSSSNFGNGMVIPIQPFVQNVPNTLQQGYVQNVPQLQPSIVQIQSQNIDPLFQQPSPVHIQNQLIPVTIYQAGNQTLISNYTYTNSGSEHGVSSQSANVIQAQPVNFNMNQTQLNTNSVRMPLCRPVNAGPPPLLILPKPSNLSSLNQQCSQSQYPKKEIASFKSHKQKNPSSKDKVNSSERSHCKTFKQKAKQISSNRDSGDSVSDSIHRPPGDSEKEKEHSEGSGNVEEVDDEITKQMEELDREIKQKEQEQEEMRRKKLELLEKMKQAKSVNKKDTESELDSNGKSEIDKCDKEKTDEDRNEISESAESVSKVVETEMQKTLTDKEEVHKERNRSCKDMVLSEIAEETNDDVFDSDTPIDLSSALKSSQINGFSGANLSLTVSNGIISIKENNNNIESSMVHSDSNLETENEGGESEFDCMEDDDSVLRDNYQTGKCDGINYIEDIGLVNPFTGEYEINEDVEGVEYLDLSTKPDEGSNDKDSETVEDNDNGKDMEIVVSECRNEDKSAVCSIKMQTDQQKVSERVEVEPAEETSSISSEKSATKMLPVSASITKPVSTITDTIKQSFISTLSSSMTAVSVLSSSAPTMSCSVTQLSSVSKSGYCKSADVSSAITDESLNSGKPCDIDVNVSEEHYVNNNCDVEDAPLNLEKAKPTTSLVKSGYSNVFTSASTDKYTQNTQINTKTQSVTQSEKNLTPTIKECEVTTFKSDAPGQNFTKFQRPEMNLKNVQESQTQVADSQVPSLPVDTSVPQIQLSSQSSTVRSRPSRIQKVMLQQDKQVLGQDIAGPVNMVCDNRQIVSKQNPRMNSDNRHSRGMFQRRIREKYMELKPAHYKSPPRKIQKGEKAVQAHSQKPTSRETMKKMCRTPFIHPHVVYKTSPYVCRKYPVFLSPKEVEKPFPRLWEKRPPKPAHSKRPFGIAGHLIVQSSRKYRKRVVSGDLATSPRFYSLPNTPTSTNATPPRATSADYHSTYSPLQSPTETQDPSNSVATSTSANKTGDHHGAQVGLPSPIRAHCRPKSMISCSQFYETSVLRPPALLRNSRPQVETSANDVIEIIDLTADVPPPPRSDSAAKSAESPKSKEKAIQKELSHAVSKRQRLDNVEASPNERANFSSQNAAVRQQQLLSEIVARQRLMPPPPYTGRQRMPVLVQVPRPTQVPRRPALEPQQRMSYSRRMDPQLDDNRRLIAQNMVQPDMQRFQKPPDRMQVNEPQIRPQMWSSQYVAPTQDTRAYGARVAQVGVHTQDLSSGNEQLIQNQDVGPMRGAPQQMMYPPRGAIQTAGMTGYVGNARMPYPSNVPVNSVPQQGYPIRGQNMPYTTTQNPTQIHQLLQQQRASSQMMPRGDPSTQMMQRGEMSPQMMQRGEISPQMMHRGETSPQMLHRGEISPQMMQRGDISPQMMQRGEVSPQIMHRGEISPQMMQRGETSPQMMQRVEVSPQMIQRGVTSPQMIMNGSLSPHGMQRGMSTQMIQNVSTGMPVMQTPNVQMMPTGEINQKVLYPAGNGSQMMNAGNTSPQISPTGMLAQAQAQAQMIQNASVNGYQRPQIQSDNQMQGPSSAVQSTLTPEQRFQRMQQIRAQHIRSQQLHNRGAQVGFEQGVRMSDTRTQHVGIDPNSTVVNASTGPQQMPGYNMALPHPSTGPKGPHLQTSTYPQQMAVLEPQMERGIHPHHQGQQVLESGNKGLAPPPYPVAGSQTQSMIPATIPQPTHFHQTGVQNNINTMQQNNFVPRPAVYISNQNMQVPQSKPVSSVMNVSQHTQNIQGQGHMTQMPSCMVSLSQGRQVQGQEQYSSQIQANGTVVPGGQTIQGQNISNISDSAHNYHQNKVGQFQNQNWRAPVLSSEQQAMNVTTKGQMVVTQQNAAKLHAVSSVNSGKNVLLGDGSSQQNINKTKDLTVAMVTETQHANVIPHSQPTVAMTTNQMITQNATPQDVATNQIHHSEVNNTQVSPSTPQGQSEGPGETKVMEEEELPHLQQVHGECVMCGKYSLYLCSNCKKIWYCSPECQLTHWQTHANECEGQTD